VDGRVVGGVGVAVGEDHMAVALEVEAQQVGRGHPFGAGPLEAGPYGVHPLEPAVQLFLHRVPRGPLRVADDPGRGDDRLVRLRPQLAETALDLGVRLVQDEPVRGVADGAGEAVERTDLRRVQRAVLLALLVREAVPPTLVVRRGLVVRDAVLGEVTPGRVLDVGHVLGLVEQHVVGDRETLGGFQRAQRLGVTAVCLGGVAHGSRYAFRDVLRLALVGVTVRLAGAGEEGDGGTRGRPRPGGPGSSSSARR